MDIQSWTLADRVVHEVAARTDTDPLHLPPLYEVIDPDALESTMQASEDGHVAFQYAACCVTVTSDGSVSVADDCT